MKKVVRGMVALAGLAVFGGAQAANWIAVSTETGTGAQVFVDYASIKKQPDGTILVWDKFVYPTPQGKAPYIYTTQTNQHRINCAARQMAIGAMYWYGRKGALVYQHDGFFALMKDVVPESVGENMLSALCQQ